MPVRLKLTGNQNLSAAISPSAAALKISTTGNMKLIFHLIVLLSAASSENDLFLNFCGTWRHGGGNNLTLNVSLSPGCTGLSVSAGQQSLSVRGRITAQCQRDEVVPLGLFGWWSESNSDFCVFWEPMLDMLKLQIGGKNLTLCWPSHPRDSCCTDLSHGSNTPEAEFGIKDGKIREDVISSRTLVAYNFKGISTNCKSLCDQASGGPVSGSMLDQETQLQDLEHPCAEIFVVQMKEYNSYNITFPVPKGGNPTVSIQLPPALSVAASKHMVSLTFHTNNSLFQEGYTDVEVLRDVMEITVENTIISNLSEPVRITFQHQVVPTTRTRRCVSWDTGKDAWLVNWLVDGCETIQRGDTHTDCQCNHLTYFTVLLELEPGPIRHLLALTAITSLGCAVSFMSCVVLCVHLCKKRKRSNEQSLLIHLGLCVSVGMLSLLFFFTGVLANVTRPVLCMWVGALLHYALLSSFAWMLIEVFHTFWLVYMVFSPSPRPYIWTLLGFGLPSLPVVILAMLGNIYGLTEVNELDNPSVPYHMCWLTRSPDSRLAHLVINWSMVGVLTLSGLAMLFLVYRHIRTREEWKQNSVTFLSIWGLSVLFGTAWVLPMMTFGPATDFIRFIACILTSFQGFFLMLRFLLLDWMRKQARSSVLSNSSTGSTRQHMLQVQKR